MNSKFFLFYIFFISCKLLATNENLEPNNKDIVKFKSQVFCTYKDTKKIFEEKVDFYFKESGKNFDFDKTFGIVCFPFDYEKLNIDEKKFIPSDIHKLFSLIKYIHKNLYEIYMYYEDFEELLKKNEKTKNWDREFIKNLKTDFGIAKRSFKSWFNEQKIKNENDPEMKEILTNEDVFLEDINKNLSSEEQSNCLSQLYNALAGYRIFSFQSVREAKNNYINSKVLNELREFENIIGFSNLKGFNFDEIVKIAKCINEKMMTLDEDYLRNISGTCGWFSYANSYLALRIANSEDCNLNEIKDIFTLPLFFADPKFFHQTKAPAASNILKMLLGYYPTPGTLSLDLAEYTKSKFISNDDFQQTMSDIKNALEEKTPVIINITPPSHWITIVAYNEETQNFFLLDNTDIRVISFNDLECKMNFKKGFHISRLLCNIDLIKGMSFVFGLPVWSVAYTFNYICPNEYYSKTCCQALKEIWQVKKNANLKKYNYLILK